MFFVLVLGGFLNVKMLTSIFVFFYVLEEKDRELKILLTTSTVKY